MHLELFSAPVWINLAKITFSYLKKFKLHFRDAMPLIFTSAVETKVANLVFVWFCFSWQLKHWKNINLTCQKTDCPVFWISSLRAFIKYLSLIELYRYYSREKPFLKRLQGISFKHTLLVCFVVFLVVFFTITIISDLGTWIPELFFLPCCSHYGLLSVLFFH